MSFVEISNQYKVKPSTVRHIIDVYLQTGRSSKKDFKLLNPKGVKGRPKGRVKDEMTPEEYDPFGENPRKNLTVRIDENSFKKTSTNSRCNLKLM